MKKLMIDLETRSDADIIKTGVYRYADSPYFDILLFAYSVDDSQVQVVDLACGELLPDDILHALTDDSVMKHSYNASFERVCLSVWLKRNYPDIFYSYSIPEDAVGNYLSPDSWHCSMVASAYLGLPLTLAGVGSVLKLEQQKMTEGKALIKYFCVPYAYDGKKPLFHTPSDAPEKWEIFKAYNKRDVETEMGIERKISRFPVPDSVWKEYHLDQEINDRGIQLDLPLVRNAIRIGDCAKDHLTEKLCKLTGIENPNSVQQMKEWLKSHSVEIESLGKKEVQELIDKVPPEIREVLLLRQQTSKSSVKKYSAMQNAVCSDGRARGMFQFYGANRTGREAGRIIQLQNLPQNHIPDLEEARNLVLSGDMDALEFLYEDIPDTLSQLIRTSFVPKTGYKFIVADFSAIEARVIAWLADEQWRMDAFANGEDIYCASASKMFGVPVVNHGVNGHLRQKGKVAELACIAEGQLVLTDNGLVPIEKVTTDMKIWDGEEWVQHDGVVYRGEREVITYEGLTATPDHLVWIEGQSKPIQFGVAASCGAHLIQTGDGRQTIRLGEDYQSGKKVGCILGALLRFNPMLRLWINSMESAFQSGSWSFKRLSELLTTKTDSIMVGQKAYSSKTKMREPGRQGLSQLRSKGYPISVFKRYGSRIVPDQAIWTTKSGIGNRQNRQQWGLCSRKYPFCLAHRKQPKQTHNCAFTLRTAILALYAYNSSSDAFKRNDKKRDSTGGGGCCYRKKEMLETHIRTARLYDIRNAGRHHRFTVSGKLVHNCGYSGSVGAMKAMGADAMGLSDNELKQIVTDWRNASPNIVQLWWDVERAAIKAVSGKTQAETHGIKFSYESGFMFIELPSGRRLAYVKPRIEENRFGSESITYDGVGASKKWERLETYSGKLVENIVQGIARDLLFYSLQTLSHCFIVGHIHDEMIIEADRRMSLQTACEQMARTPKWAEGLLLRADGYECEFYKKD